jgi:predicted enzyme related to lactoylglutathione lyase
MAKKTDHIPGAPCWVDLTTSDQARARDFYTAVFGWTAEEPNDEFGGYLNFQKDGVRVAGCMSRMPGQPGPDVWSVHLSTPDARATLETAKQNGGQVVVEAMAVADLGTMSVLADPAGGVTGAWQPGTHPGFGRIYEDGAPTWFELHTHAYEQVVDFYTRTFGWATEPQPQADTPGFRYTLVKDGVTPIAGVMDDSSFTPADTPTHWVVYFGTHDCDATAAAIKAAGGTVVREPEDTPYGRLASATDPTGASFNLMQANREAPEGIEPAAAAGTV